MFKLNPTLICDHCGDDIEVGQRISIVHQTSYSGINNPIALLEVHEYGGDEWHYHITCYDEEREMERVEMEQIL
jgi:hypothetical protein